MGLRASEAFDWTDERIERLKILWAAGGSGSEIAKGLGPGLTRCSVISKVHRLIDAGKLLPRFDPDAGRKAHKRAEVARMAKEARRHGETAEEAVAAPAPAPVAVVVALAPELPRLVAPVALEAVSEGDCRWPIGDPTSREFAFCGARQKPGRPYCDAHCQMAYATPHAARKSVEIDRDGEPKHHHRQRLRPGQTSLWR